MFFVTLLLNCSLEHTYAEKFKLLIVTRSTKSLNHTHAQLATLNYLHDTSHDAADILMKKPATNYMHDCYVHINSLFQKLILPGSVCTCIAVGDHLWQRGTICGNLTLSGRTTQVEARTICGVTKHIGHDEHMHNQKTHHTH